MQIRHVQFRYGVRRWISDLDTANATFASIGRDEWKIAFNESSPFGISREMAERLADSRSAIWQDCRNFRNSGSAKWRAQYGRDLNDLTFDGPDQRLYLREQQRCETNEKEFSEKQTAPPCEKYKRKSTLIY